MPTRRSLAVAGQLPGGVTRSNFTLALCAFGMRSLVLIPGIALQTDGLNDAYLLEGGIFQRWNATKQSWENEGNVIDLNGKAKLCSWDIATSTCK